MDTSIAEIIVVGASAVAIIGFGVTLWKMNTNTQLKIHENTIRINENEARIIAIEKDLAAMKKKHDEDVKSVKSDFAVSMQQMREDFRVWLKEHRDEHRDINRSITEACMNIVSVTTKLETYLDK